MTFASRRAPLWLHFFISGRNFLTSLLYSGTGVGEIFKREIRYCTWSFFFSFPVGMVRWTCKDCGTVVDTEDKATVTQCYQGFACGEKGEANSQVCAHAHARSHACIVALSHARTRRTGGGPADLEPRQPVLQLREQGRYRECMHDSLLDRALEYQ